MTRQCRTILLATLFLASTANAHDLYLTHETEGVCAGIGEEFPKSTNAITADRLNSFQVRKGEASTALSGKVTGKRFCAATPEAAPFIAEMTVQPRFIKLEAKDFNSYTHGEGLAEVEKLRAARGEQAKPGRELYSRYSKLLAGANGAAATKPLGHALEIVPERDPAQLKPGEALTVTVLFKGKPLASAQVAAVYAGAVMKGHEYPVTARTGNDGKAVLKLDRPGLWYARLIYMEPAQNDPDVDWRSYFATITFTF